MWRVSEPVIREWIERNLGPIGRIEDLGKDALDLVRAAGRLPDLIQRTDAALAAFEQGRPGPVDLAPAKESRFGAGTLALWGIALILLAMLVRG